METTSQGADAIKALLLEHINGERLSGFAQLRQVPSTYALQFLRYFDTLDSESAGVFCAGLAEGAFDSLFPNHDYVPLYKRNAAYRKYVDTIGKVGYLDYRGLRGYLAAARQGGKPLSPKTRERAEAIIPISSGELRKRIKIALSDFTSPLKVTHEGQYWVYTGVYDGNDLSVTINYSSAHYQLDYWVTTYKTRLGTKGSNFERLMGLNFAQWDNIDQRNADVVIQLLLAHVRYCIVLLRSLPKL